MEDDELILGSTTLLCWVTGRAGQIRNIKVKMMLLLHCVELQAVYRTVHFYSLIIACTVYVLHLCIT